MCLAVPAKITQIAEDMTATAEIMGVSQRCALDLVPTAQVGDYVLIHAGYAIEVMGAEDARQTLEIVQEMQALEDAAGPR
jgi:hydrogenase expression/formation protein HypC